MRFRTELKIPEFSYRIEHADTIVAIGSCFAENISRMMKRLKFNILENPFGVIYNPASIYNSLELIKSSKKFEEQDLLFYQGEYHSFYHHSRFSNSELKECLERINLKLEETKKYLNAGNSIIITYGTAYVYEYIERGIVVSNCHKIPTKEFNRYFLSYDECCACISQTVELIKSLNAEAKIIFTVSPVRHLKDGFAENQVSKSTLLLSVDKAVKKFENCYYFPSYEIMMDDLRDYRFYDKDLVHPNDIAVNYIWEKFSEALLSLNCKEVINEVEKIVHAAEHRVRNPQNKSHQSFLSAQLKMIEELEKKYSHLNFEEEKALFIKQVL